jgi:hypothetical protein
MVNPSRAFFLTLGASSAEDGTADLQTSSNFAVSSFAGQFGIVMDGQDATPQLLSRIGTLVFKSGKLTLNELVNASSTGTGTQLLGGVCSVSANGRMICNLSNGRLNFVMYAVSSSRTYVLQSDAGTLTSGVTQLQQ